MRTALRCRTASGRSRCPPAAPRVACVRRQPYAEGNCYASSRARGARRAGPSRVAAVDDDWGLAAFVFTLTQLELYRFDDVASTLVPINQSVTKLDAHVLILAVSTTLRQFHADQTTSYLSHLGAFARAEISARRPSSSSSPDVFAPRARASIAWARAFATAHDVNLTVLASFFPPFVFSHAFVA